MPSNFKFNNGGNQTDFDDAFIKKDLFTSGGLWTWGTGRLGNNTTSSRSSPIQTISGGANWKQVSTTLVYVAATKTDGTLWTWGSNPFGNLGTNDRTDRSSPVQTVAAGTNWKEVSVGYYHTTSIKTDGTLWLWGYNYQGAIGDNTTTNRSSPVQTIAGGANWKQSTAGEDFTAAIKTDGTLWMWGYNGYGQLGINNASFRQSPVQTVAAGTNWKQVSCGRGSTAAIKTDGTLWTWGGNSYGQLGNNAVADRSSPVQTVAAGTNWKQVSVGQHHTAAIKTDGTLWLWGRNQFGQLGDNTVTNRSSPVQTVAAGTNWKQASGGRFHSAAIKTDGTL
jgi:alpha-tubulin suppressor-like RCC1 family protein